MACRAVSLTDRAQRNYTLMFMVRRAKITGRAEKTSLPLSNEARGAFAVIPAEVD